MKKKINKAKLDKRKLLWAHEDKENSLIYHFCKYKKNSDKSRYLAYNKLKRLNTKIQKLSDKLKDAYGITAGTDHLQCAEPPDTIIKCANFNRIPI